MNARLTPEREALEALSLSVDVMACASDPTVPCAEVETGFEWPDDWCFPCYVRRIVQEALTTETA